MNTQEFSEFQKSLSPSQTFVIVDANGEVATEFSEGCEVYQKSKIDYIDGFNAESSLKLNLFTKSINQSIEDGKTYPIDKDFFYFAVVSQNYLGNASLFRSETYRNGKSDDKFYAPKSAMLLSIIILDKDGNYHSDFVNGLGEPKLQSMLLTSLSVNAYHSAFKSIIKDNLGLTNFVKQRAVYELTTTAQNYTDKQGTVWKNVPTAKFAIKKFLPISKGEMIYDFSQKNFIFDLSVVKEIVALGNYNGIDTLDQEKHTVQYVLNALSKFDIENRSNILAKANKRREFEYKMPAFNFVEMFSGSPQLASAKVSENDSANLQVGTGQVFHEDVSVVEENLPFSI